MALLGRYLRFPDWIASPTLLPLANQGGSAVDAVLANRYYAMMFRVPKSGTITKLGVRNGVSGAFVGTWEGALQTVTSGNLPSGTDYGGSAPGSMTDAAANTTYEVTLATPATATKDDMVCMRFRLTARTSGQIRPVFVQNPNAAFRNAQPYARGTLDSTLQCLPLQWPIYSDGSIGVVPGLLAYIDAPTVTISSSTTPDEIAAEFTLPVGVRAGGIYLCIPSTTTSADTVRLLDASNNVLATFAAGPAAGGGYVADGFAYFVFSSPITLSPGVIYRISYLPGASNRIILRPQFPSSAHKVLGYDPAWNYSSRVDGGSWTPDDAYAAPFGLLIDGITSGGLLRHPGMQGEMAA